MNGGPEPVDHYAAGMGTPHGAVLLSIAFLAELAACAAFAVGAAHPFDGIVAWLAGAAAVAAALGLWSVLAAPKSPRRLRGSALLAFKLAFFVAAALSLAAAGHVTLAIALAVASVVDTLLLTALGMDVPASGA